MRVRVRVVAAAGAFAAAVVAGGGVAYAVLSQQATGTGTATAINPVQSTITAGTGAADLYPGGAGRLYFTVDNRNPYPVAFTSVTAASVSHITATGTCTAADFTLAVPLTLPTPIAVAANTTTGSAATVGGLLRMKPTAGNGCESAAVQVTLTLQGTQS